MVVVEEAEEEEAGLDNNEEELEDDEVEEEVEDDEIFGCFGLLPVVEVPYLAS